MLRPAESADSPTEAAVHGRNTVAVMNMERRVTMGGHDLMTTYLFL